MTTIDQAESVAIWREGSFVDDSWTMVADEVPLPERDVIVSVVRFSEDREVLLSRNGRLGLLIDTDDDLDATVAAVGDLSRLSLIALSFPKFQFGQSYSRARLLRERHGFSGELRAVGDILIDQIPFMLRCGFESFEISHEPTRAALERGDLPAIDLFYQPLDEGAEAPVAGRSWLRRAAE
ncbi:uncharacterized protein (DUF934 family) [Rhodobium orientis]|uniref:Oxidoreductase n=1 Tax=Rhodobium orientis TaxID=34017 RepID=A0A327JTQ0_9HYPH|nr:DUF934 domain-containing protein [Rhodobium orientis]MBB4305194.1 uncharacterized protein (DUF934 family) [Rhodobium orientis]MBK5948703.1 hypothetical protein [Rhodobium orientis]RAI26678.1 hypothetical protein CH339_13095 [Rhodobium orientis]